MLENWDSEPPHELDIFKELIKEGNQWAKEQLQLRALNKEHSFDAEVQNVAEDALLDLVNANDPEGVKLMVHLLTTEGAAASPYLFEEFNHLIDAGKAGALHVLKNLALQGDPIAIQEIIRLAESNPTKFGNLAAFLFMLQHQYPNHPAAKRLGSRLGGGELPELAETLAAMARLYAQFESRDTETVRSIKQSLGTRVEVEQCLAIQRQQTDAARA